MKKIKKLFITVMVGFLILAIPSCTDLEEETLSILTPDNFFQNEEEFQSTLGSAYTGLYPFIQHVWVLAELTSDEMVLPVRGNSWGRPLQREMHLNTWRSGHARIGDLWNFLFAGVATTNRLIFQLEEVGVDETAAFIAEMKTFRALWYLYIIDFFGNVPIVDKFDVADDFAPSNNNNRAEVYAFIEADILGSLSALTQDVNQNTYGRINYWVAQTILAKLYINAEVYTGTAQWDKAEAAIDEIMNSGLFSMSANYFDNFNLSNSNSLEFILAIPYDEINAGGFDVYMGAMLASSRLTYNRTQSPWNGYAVVADFYESYIDPVANPGSQGDVIGMDGSITTGTEDVRLAGFIAGPQYEFDGVTRITDPAFEEPDPYDPEKPFDPDGAPVNYTPFINEFQPNALRQAGARIQKWEYEIGSVSRNMNNDYAIFRYTDILLMKAEVRLRQSDAAAGLPLVNMIRSRAGVDDYTVLTLDNLLAERGRELFGESWRRSDLIRFGVNNEAWWAKPATSATVNLFPIPQVQMDANANLTQNPGY